MNKNAALDGATPPLVASSSVAAQSGQTGRSRLDAADAAIEWAGAWRDGAEGVGPAESVRSVAGGSGAGSGTRRILGTGPVEMLCALQDLDVLVSGTDAHVAGYAEMVSQLSDEQLCALVAGVETLSRRVQAIQTRAAGELEARCTGPASMRLSSRLGCRNAVEVISRISGASRPAIVSRIRLDQLTSAQVGLTGQRIEPRYPFLGEALYRGQVGVDAAREIMKMLAQTEGLAERDKHGYAERYLTNTAVAMVPAQRNQCGIEARDGVDSTEDTGVAGVFEAGAPADAGGTVDGESAGSDGLDGSDSAGSSGSLGGPGSADGWDGSAVEHTIDAGVVHSFDELRTVVQAWGSALSGGETREPTYAVANRSLHLGQETHGLVAIRGSLLVETAAGLQNLLNAHLNPASHNDLSVDSSDPRSAAQQRHDVLTMIIQAAARAASTPQLGGAAPTLMVHTSTRGLDANRKGVPSLPRKSSRFKLGDAEFERRVAEIEHPGDRGGVKAGSSVKAGSVKAGSSQAAGVGLGGLDSRELGLGDPEAGVIEGFASEVDPQTIRRLSCTADVMMGVFGADHVLLSLHSVQRTFTPTQRKAIIARDGGCIIPGCSVPAGWCEIHHVTEHSRGGPTHIANGVLLCWFHHHHLESSGWKIRMIRGVPHVCAPKWIDPAQTYRAVAKNILYQRQRIEELLDEPRDVSDHFVPRK